MNNERRKPGPKPEPFRMFLREQFSEWSERTFATYYMAWRRLSVLQEHGVITLDERKDIMRQCCRPNGSINVCKFARIAEALIAFWLAEQSEGSS